MPKQRNDYPTAEKLDELFKYSVITGHLYRRIQRGKSKEGDIAGWTDSNGYRTVRVDGKTYPQHNLIWIMITRSLPTADKTIDHCDRDPTNNAWHNLRDATDSEQMINRDYPLGASGEKHIAISQGRFNVIVCRNLTHHYGGRADTLAEAIVLRDDLLASLNK